MPTFDVNVTFAASCCKTYRIEAADEERAADIAHELACEEDVADDLGGNCEICEIDLDEDVEEITTTKYAVVLNTMAYASQTVLVDACCVEDAERQVYEGQLWNNGVWHYEGMVEGLPEVTYTNGI